jgi:hypothetical protein
LVRKSPKFENVAPATRIFVGKDSRYLENYLRRFSIREA